MSDVKPCVTCPYRREVKRAHWAKAEYDNLIEQDRHQFGATFACHGHIKLAPKERGPCIGWMLDQKRRGIPSLSLRMALLGNRELAATFEAIDEEGLSLYGSIEEMAEANYPTKRSRRRSP